MRRLHYLIPLLAGLAILGCSSQDRDELSFNPQSPAKSSLAATDPARSHAPDHIAQRPSSPITTTSDDLPLWPPSSSAPSSPSPSAPPLLPPAGLVPEGAPPALTTEAAPGVVASEGVPTFVPPNFEQPAFQPAAEPTPTPVDPPAATLTLNDANPLREAPQPAAPTSPFPPLPKPGLPRIPAGNPLRSSDSDPTSGSLPTWPHQPIQTAPAPIGESPNLPQFVPLLPSAPAEGEMPPLVNPGASALAPSPAIAPVEPQPEESVPLVTPEPVKPAFPTKLPRVSVIAGAKKTEPPTAAPKALSRKSAPLVTEPSGGSATPYDPAEIAKAYGPPPDNGPTIAGLKPRMLSPGTKLAEPPSVTVPFIPLTQAETAPPPPPRIPAMAAPAPVAPAEPAPTETAPPESVPAAADPPAADPPTFVPPASDPPASDPPTFAPPMFDPPAAEPPLATLEPQPAAVEAAPAPVEAMLEPPAAVAARPAPPTATSALVPPTDPNQAFDVVRVFYGTDRKPILVNEDSLLARLLRFLPALLLIVLTGIGIGVVWVSRKITWFVGTSALAFFSVVAVWHGVYETLEIAEAAAREEPRYSAEKSVRGQVELGTCEVAIPKTHDKGELEGPSVFRFEREFDPEKHVTLRNTVRMHDDAFYDQLRAQVASSPEREILVFVHGFNVSFEDAARRTAQMAHDLKLQGAPVFYSWPADKYFMLTYGKDETSVGWSAPHLKEFLLDLVHNTDARAINLVAHSMGNRALTSALCDIDLQLRDEARLFNQVVLAAPDIDADDFRDNIAPAIQRTSRQVTLYASSKDIALGASRFFHRNARAGDTSRGLVLVAGIDTIDVSNIDGGPWGHSYVGTSDPVLRDLHLLLTSLPPERRTWLKMNEQDGQTYWAFKPLGSSASGNNSSTPALIQPR